MPTVGTQYHVFIGSQGLILSRSNRKKGTYFYEKKRAPTFVNKFGSGDSSYRDASFWQYFVQTNWRNGAQQLKFNDFGKFWKSENVDVNELEKLQLSRSLTSIGQLASGIRVKKLVSWRSSQNWWDANYDYRQQLVVTASTVDVPKGFPVKITIDTAALETASKLRSDRKDWRVLYWNGSSWTDLTRHYVSTTSTMFALQEAITAGQSSTRYYVYYGYASESTTKQPSTEDEFNSVYAMYKNSDTDFQPDSNSKIVLHAREGSGTTVNDDTDNSNGVTLFNTPTWSATGLLGFDLDFNGTTQYGDAGSGSDVELGSMTLEGWFKFDVVNAVQYLFGRWEDLATNNKCAYSFFLDANGKLNLSKQTGVNTASTITTSNSLSAGVWYHLSATYDGSATGKIFVNRTEQSVSGSITGSVNQASGVSLEIGRNEDDGGQSWFNGKWQHLRVSNVARSSFPYGLGESEVPTVTSEAETVEQPSSSSFSLYAGGSDGKIYKWDGTTTFTEQFDARRLEWYEDGYDTDMKVGDDAGTEKAEAQSFQVDAVCTMKSVELYLKKLTGTPGDITVRIETNNAGVPSGTLVDAAATTTITSFSTTSYAWKEATFATAFALAGSTTYWIVLKTAAAANDNNYAWGGDGSSPTYSAGGSAASTDGGSTWTGDTAKDMHFRLNGQVTEVNCALVTDIGGTQKMLFGVGSPTSETNGDARIYSYNGSSWVLEKIFTTTTSSQVLSLEEYEDKLYAGLGPKAIVHEGTSPSSWSVSENIKKPQNPGFVFDLIQYNGVLYAVGGSPEYMYDDKYNGFLYSFDTTEWRSVYPFSFTVVTSMEFYDSFLFIGTYNGQLFIFDTASLTPIFSWNTLYNYNVTVSDMKYHDDKLFISLYPQDNSNETNVGIWVYDRHGLSLAYHKSGVTGYTCMEVINNMLVVGTGDDGYVYKVDPNAYALQGYEQSSYFDANLPSINKLYQSVEIKHDPLPTGTNVKVYYKFKESDSWTLLGTSDTVASTSKVMEFSTGIYAKQITLKTEINTTDPTQTPVVTERILQYTLYPERKWLWNIRVVAKAKIGLLDRTNSTGQTNTIRTALEALLATPQLVVFTDIDGTEYNVLTHEIDQSSWVVNQNVVNENEIAISLLEA